MKSNKCKICIDTITSSMLHERSTAEDEIITSLIRNGEEATGIKLNIDDHCDAFNDIANV